MKSLLHLHSREICAPLGRKIHACQLSSRIILSVQRQCKFPPVHFTKQADTRLELFAGYLVTYLVQYVANYYSIMFCHYYD